MRECAVNLTSPPSLSSFPQAATSHDLGRPLGRAAADFSAHPGVYGRRAQRTEAGEWGVGDCIRGDYTEEDQKPDADLGRSVTPGFRNAGYADPARAFGLPSVRMDVAPRASSLATATDFGEGTSAAKLLAPCAYADLGVGEEDFLQPLAPGRIRMLFSNIGTRMSDAEFAAIYNQVRRRAAARRVHIRNAPRLTRRVSPPSFPLTLPPSGRALRPLLARRRCHAARVPRGA